MKREEEQYQEVIALLQDLKRCQSTQSHIEEHEFLRQLIEERKARTEYMNALKLRLMSTGLWTIITGIGFAIVYTLKHYLSGQL